MVRSTVSRPDVAVRRESLTVAGRDRTFITARGRTPRPGPVLTIHGTADPLAPFEGGIVGYRGRFPKGMHLSAPQTAEYFATRNGITGEPCVTQLAHRGAPGDATSVTSYDYTSPGASPVRFYAVHGGGHVLPNPKRASVQWLWGPSTRDLCAADAVADFFRLPTAN